MRVSSSQHVIVIKFPIFAVHRFCFVWPPYFHKGAFLCTFAQSTFGASLKMRTSK